MYQLALEHAGHSVVITSDGIECLKAYREASDALEETDAYSTSFDVVILDCRMPFMSCAEVANEILAINKRQPISIAAAYLGPSEVALLNNRQIRMLLKPFEPKELIKLVDEISR